MPTYKTEGFILRKKALGEVDRLYSIFTRDHGKIEAVADGTAKISSKLAGNLEPFCFSNLMIADGRFFERIAGAQIADNYLTLKTDLFNWSLLWIISEGLNCLTVSHLTEPQIYQLLKKLLNYLSDRPDRENKIFLVLQFFWLIFRLLGQRPRVEAVAADQEIYFDKSQSLFKKIDKNNPDNYLKINSFLLNLLFQIDDVYLKKQDFLLINNLERKALENFYQLVIAYYQNITSRQFNSFKFLSYGK